VSAVNRLLTVLVAVGAGFAWATEPPACSVADVPAPAASLARWADTVLDTHFVLPADYAPTDLVPAGAFVGASAAEARHLVRAIVVDDLRALFEAAAEAGFPLAIQSAYRSYDYQERTFAYWVEQDGYDAAIRTSARPGHSEHQLGTAIDLRSADGPPAWELDDWAATPTGAWVSANAWRFGFTMSYPPGMEHASCYAYEPWHLRYLGRERAAEVHASGAPARLLLWRALTEEDRAQH
jgi:zinc D-Ala-D-Ala carboxypeptidase